jgi:hypothetical protein
MTVNVFVQIFVFIPEFQIVVIMALVENGSNIDTKLSLNSDTSC